MRRMALRLSDFGSQAMRYRRMRKRQPRVKRHSAIGASICPAWTGPSNRATISSVMPMAPGTTTPSFPPTAPAPDLLSISISRAKIGCSGILNELETKQDLSPEEKKVADLYNSFIDTAEIERLGLAPAQKALDAIAAAKTHDDVARLMGRVGLQLDGPVRAGIGSDDKNPDAYAVFLRQSGLGLPDRDYYLIDEKDTAAARTAYRPYIAEIFNLAGVADADTKAARIFNLETEIAKLHWARADRRDAEKTYNPMSIAELEHFAPAFPGGSI